MYKLLFSLLITLVFCSTKNETADKASSAPRLALNRPTENFKLLLMSDALSPELETYVSRNNIQKVAFVNDGQFLSKTAHFTYDQKGLEQELLRAFPDPNQTGIAYIDLEAPYLEHLQDADLNSEDFKKSKKLFLDVLTYAQQKRPNVKWGFYGIPFTNYWDRSEAFYAKNAKVADIIRKSDVLFPSIYIFYNYVNFQTENSGFIKDNTVQAIKIAQQYQRPVYPMIMTRYHPSNAKVGNKSINLEDFTYYARTIKEARYENHAVDGIVLWNADGYFNRTKVDRIAGETAQSRMPFQTYYNGYLRSYLDALMQMNRE